MLLKKDEVQQFATKLAKSLEPGIPLLLTGDLGAGKTFLAGELIKFLMEDESLIINSPTFSLVNIYTTPKNFAIYHFDLYRLKDENELENIGFFEGLNEGICIIEWPEIAKKHLQNTLEVNIKFINENTREFLWQHNPVGRCPALI